MMLMLGQGLPRDYEEGRFWLQQAGRAGLAVAQVNLAGLYERGLGVEPDPVEAVAWYGLAVANGDAAANGMLEKLRAGLSPPERARAQALMTELRTTHPDIVQEASASPHNP